MTEYHQFVQRAAASIFAELGSSITDPFQLRVKSEEAWRRAHMLAAQFEHLDMDAKDCIDRLHAAATTFLDFHSDMFEYDLDAVEPSVVVRTVSPVKDQGGLVVVEKPLWECSPFVVFEKLAHYLRRLRKQPVELLQGIHVKLITSTDTAEDFQQISQLLAEDRIPELYRILGKDENPSTAEETITPDFVTEIPDAAWNTTAGWADAGKQALLNAETLLQSLHLRFDNPRLELEDGKIVLWVTYAGHVWPVRGISPDDMPTPDVFAHDLRERIEKQIAIDEQAATKTA